MLPGHSSFRLWSGSGRGLREQHPHLKVEVELTNRLEDLLGREADIAVRMVRPLQEQLIALSSFCPVSIAMHFPSVPTAISRNVR